MNPAVPARTEPLLPARTVWKAGWRHLLRHPWQSVLMILGIALGVAVVVAIDLANTSAGRAFELSTETVAGRATHQIVGGPQGLDEAIYTELKTSDRFPPSARPVAAPIIAEYVSSPQLGNRPLQLLGIDPFAEAPFRSYLGSDGAVPIANLTAFLTQPGAILISTDLAGRYGLASGAHVTLDIGGHPRSAAVAGLLKPSDDVSRRALDGILLADIATAQELTGRIGKLDRIDLILPPSGAPSLSLPPGIHLQPVQARQGAIEQMTAAFRTNLTALSLLALVVGMFLIYNTMTFSVVQRRPLLGTLRCLGVTRREIFMIVVGEAAVVGVMSAALGLGLGIILGQGAVRLVTQTINDLYFTLNVSDVEIPLSSLVKGGLLGILATVVTAALPAWEASTVPPRAALLRSGLESKARQAVAWIAAAGLVLLIAGAVTLVLPTRSLVVSFAGTFVVVAGAAMLAPATMAIFMRGATPITGQVWGTLGRMAPRNVLNALSRTSIAVAALMVAVSVTIGVSLMISSFRYTVVSWLSQTLQGDIYITTPGVTATSSSAPIDPAVLQAVQRWPGVARVDTLRSATVDSPIGPVRVAATQNPGIGKERVFVSVDRAPQDIWAAMQNGAVLVSEPFVNRAGLPLHGGTVTLDTDQGPHTFPIVGVYYDYTSSEGTVFMSLQTYRQLWHDDAITSIALRLAPGADAGRISRGLEDSLASTQQLLVRPNRELRQDVLAVFDRTFAITGALQLLATLVAFIGVLSALLSLQLEKQRELGILRAVGLTVRQLWKLALLETGLMGAAAGLLAMPTGLALSFILIYVINRRSFGWTLQMRVGVEPFIQALAVAVIAALLAGIYPARRMGKMMAADALRFE